MNRVQRYIQNARQRVQQEHLGFIDDQFYFAPQDNMFYADGSMQAAQSAAPSAPVKKSQPYIIIVSSASASSVANFNVLGYSLYFNNPSVTFTSGGNLVNGSITLSSGVPNATYRDLLNQSNQNPFTAGLTYVVAATPASQAQTAFTINTFDANGNLVSIPIIPVIDPYQQQANAIVVNNEFRVDGQTYLQFSQIQANAVFTIYIYPSNNYNPSRTVAGMDTMRQYGNPGIVRSSIATVGGQMVKSRVGS